MAHIRANHAPITCYFQAFRLASILKRAGAETVTVDRVTNGALTVSYTGSRNRAILSSADYYNVRLAIRTIRAGLKGR